MKDIDKYILRADNEEQAILLSEEVAEKLWSNMPPGTLKRAIVSMNSYGAFFNIDAPSPEDIKRHESGHYLQSLNLTPEEADIFCAAWLKYRSVNQRED